MLLTNGMRGFPDMHDFSDGSNVTRLKTMMKQISIVETVFASDAVDVLAPLDDRNIHFSD